MGGMGGRIFHRSHKFRRQRENLGSGRRKRGRRDDDYRRDGDFLYGGRGAL